MLIRNPLAYTLLVPACAFAAAACGDDGGGTPTAPDGPGDFVADYRGAGTFFTRMSGFMDGASPHGNSLIWYSNNLFDLAERDSFTAPLGTVAIKEFDNDGEVGVDGLAIMVKQAAGYDPDHGDWKYEMRTLDGEVMQDPDGNPMSGPIAMCSGCHAAAASTDYLTGLELTGGADLPGPGAFPAEAEEAAGLFTLMANAVAGDSPHGTAQIWYSNNLRHLVHQSAFEAPVGAIAIKKFDMAGDGDFDGYAVMVKEAPGFDAANGDWRYEMRGLNGTVQQDDDGNPMSGSIGMCIGCHSADASTDYLAGLKLR